MKDATRAPAQVGGSIVPGPGLGVRAFLPEWRRWAIGAAASAFAVPFVGYAMAGSSFAVGAALGCVVLALLGLMAWPALVLFVVLVQRYLGRHWRTELPFFTGSLVAILVFGGACLVVAYLGSSVRSSALESTAWRAARGVEARRDAGGPIDAEWVREELERAERVPRLRREISHSVGQDEVTLSWFDPIDASSATIVRVPLDDSRTASMTRGRR